VYARRLIGNRFSEPPCKARLAGCQPAAGYQPAPHSASASAAVSRAIRTGSESLLVEGDALHVIDNDIFNWQFSFLPSEAELFFESV
jgi:hypothetical protein